LRGGVNTFAYAFSDPNSVTDDFGLAGRGITPPGAPGIGDQINPFGGRGDGSRNYTQWFNNRFSNTIAGAIAEFKRRIEQKICAAKYASLLPGLRRGADDIDIKPDMKRYGDTPQSWYERNVVIGQFELKTDDINVTWGQCDCYTYSTTMYVLENTGDNRFRALFQERKVRMGNWPLSGGGCCGPY
jgi:hypothetical protein